MGISFGSGDGGFTLIGVTSRGGTISSGAHDIVVRDTVFTGCASFNGVVGGNIVLDHNSHNNINSDQANSAARIHLPYGGSTPSGVTISNSLLAGGDTDGVQSGVGVNVVNNEFRDIREGSSSNHTDNVQLLGATGAVIRGNWVHTSGGTTQGIAAYDGLRSALIEQNVVDIPRGWGIEVYADSGSMIRHNTLPYRPPGCYGGSPCGMIDVNRKSQDAAGSGTVVVDNVATGITVQNGSSVAVRHHNLLRQSAAAGDVLGVATLIGGVGSTSYAGFALAPGTLGKGAASACTDIGINP